jgi:hypothetical protein
MRDGTKTVETIMPERTRLMSRMGETMDRATTRAR